MFVSLTGRVVIKTDVKRACEKYTIKDTTVYFRRVIGITVHFKSLTVV